MQKYGDEPFILVRLAEVYDMLQHTFSARKLAIRALHSLAISHYSSSLTTIDEVFMHWVRSLVEKQDKGEEVQMAMYNNPTVGGKIIYTGKLKRMEEYRSKEPVELSTAVMNEWNKLMQTMSEREATQAYSRLLCIETNELEDVFRLGGDSIIGLVRTGLFLGAVQHIDPASKMKDKKNIVVVPRDVQEVLY